MKTSARLSLALLALCALAAPAEARPGARLFPQDSSCYARLYDAAHLAGHPDQMVAAITLTPAPLQEPGFLVLSLRVQRRGSPAWYQAQAYCGDEPDGTLACGIEGDAGGFSVTPRKVAILVTVDPSGVWLEGGRDVLELSARQGDDRAFRLDAAAFGDCG